MQCLYFLNSLQEEYHQEMNIHDGTTSHWSVREQMCQPYSVISHNAK